MSSLLDAIVNKFEELNKDQILGNIRAHKSTRSGVARFQPSKVLVMDSMNIQDAGDETELNKIAGHCHELDLASNKINSWFEVFRILQALPKLKHLNLSQNQLGMYYVLPSDDYRLNERTPIRDANCSLKADQVDNCHVLDAKESELPQKIRKPSSNSSSSSCFSPQSVCSSVGIMDCSGNTASNQILPNSSEFDEPEVSHDNPPIENKES